MIEKKEDHLKDAEIGEQPQTDKRRMIAPCWPPPNRPLRVTFEVENMTGANRLDVSIHVSDNQQYPPYYNKEDEYAPPPPTAQPMEDQDA
jgi:secreted Zn-dependent insulinase-like peptidase